MFWPQADLSERDPTERRVGTASASGDAARSETHDSLPADVAEDLATGVVQSPSEDPVPADVEDVRIAKSLEEAKDAIVKFVVPLGIGNLTRHGTGFFIDRRGWVVTNNHVLARINTDSRVKLANGEVVEIEGIVARATEYDLAIVKLSDWPEAMTLLDVGFDDRIPLGREVFAFGHPYDAEFSLSKGIVSRNLTTKDWARDVPGHLSSTTNFPRDMRWIQHDAKISPGNSGGPLLDDEARVFGLNTFVHSKAEFGYASHVEYVRDLLATAADQLEPLPAARKGLHASISSGQIRELALKATEMRWVPQTPQEYGVVADFAKQMTIAKHLSLESAGQGKPGRDTCRRCCGRAICQVANRDVDPRRDQCDAKVCVTRS